MTQTTREEREAALKTRTFTAAELANKTTPGIRGLAEAASRAGNTSAKAAIAEHHRSIAAGRAVALAAKAKAAADAAAGSGAA